MSFLYGVIVLAISTYFFRKFFSKIGFDNRFWKVIGRRIKPQYYNVIWVILTVVFVVVVMTVVGLITSNDVIINLMYSVTFGLCFSLFPWLEIRVLGERKR